MLISVIGFLNLMLRGGGGGGKEQYNVRVFNSIIDNCTFTYNMLIYLGI